MRLTLGATPRDIVRLIVGRTSALLLAGVAAGAAASLWLATFVAPLLYGVTTHDTFSFGAAALTLLVVGALAAWRPAARAAGIPPAITLRAL